MNNIEKSYYIDLLKMLRQIKRDIDDEIVPVMRIHSPTTLDSVPVLDGWADDVKAAIDHVREKWTGKLAQLAMGHIASRYVKAAMGWHTRKMKRSFGVDLYGTSDRINQYLSAAADQNATLIKSIPAQYLDQVSNIVQGNMRQGMRPGYITSELVKQFGIQERRAKLIAVDQTGKINGELDKLRQQDAGFEYFQWVTSHDERVRHRHREIADKVTAYGKGIHRWDNLPLGSDGTPIQPGSDYNCRCIARPVSREEVEKNRRDGKTAPGVYR